MNKKNKLEKTTHIIDSVIEKMFFDLDTEIDLSQGGIFIGEKRYSREDIILWLYNKDISLEDFLLHMNIFHPQKMDDKSIDELILAIAQVYVSKEFVEDCSEVEHIIVLLKSKNEGLHPDVTQEVVHTKNIFHKIFK